MARRRRIYTRRRSSVGRRAARGTAAAIVMAAIIYFAVAGGLGNWIADKFIAPNMGGGAESTPPPETATETPALSTPEPTPVNTEEITFPAMPIYGIQLGAFANAANAQAEAERFQRRGAAGYIFMDGDRSRVLASGYRTLAEAESVHDQLLNLQGVESYILEMFIDVGDVTLRVTAPADRIRAVQDGLNGWIAALDQLESIAAKLDTGEIVPATARDELMTLAQTLERERSAFVDGAMMEGSSGAIDELSALMNIMKEKLSSLSSQIDATAMEISAQIKYTYLDSLIRYGRALQSVSLSGA